MRKFITYVGLDVHKKTISVALADEGDREVRPYGVIDSDLAALNKVIRKLVSRGAEPRFVYEAGPCGYGIYRHLKQLNIECMVAAPSLIPKKSGDRIKNDRRDAGNLARLYRAGELTAVHVPNSEDEAMRDLTRAREDSKTAERKARQQLNGFLLRHGLKYSGKSHWSLAHWRWISDIKMEHEAQQFTLQEYVDTVRSCSERVERITEQIRLLVGRWRLGPVVEALQALKGVCLVVAATVIVRRSHKTGENHQNRQRPCQANADPGRMVVSTACPGQPQVAGSAAKPSGENMADCLEGPSTTVLQISTTDCKR
jgi:transposase